MCVIDAAELLIRQLRAGSSWGYSAKNERLVGFIVAM